MPGLIAILLLSIATGAHAQSIEGGMPRAGEPSWADYAAPERRRARQLRRDGLVKLLQALESESALSSAPEVLYDQALLRFERARQVLPDDPDLLYFRATALAAWHTERDGAEERRTDEAIAAFEELRALDPDYHADRVALELAILHARRAEHRAAIAEYQRAVASWRAPPSPLHYATTDREAALARLFLPIRRSTAYLNLAENLMLLGDPESLAQAIASYRRASETAGGAAEDRTLALWGLALALDRSGDHREAMGVAGRAIDLDPLPDDAALRIDHRSHGPMAILHSALVFFEPAWEIHAYDAIGWESLARRATAADGREELLGRALRSWRGFLTAGGNQGPYAQHAQRAAERLERELADPRAP